jgi:hypothetical protein
VSLVAGQPAARDGKGGIAKLSPDGKVIAADWVTGLNAPKGLRSFKGTLWAADLDELIGVEIASGKILHRVKVPEAKFLNDVAVGPDGIVYTSDTFGNRIFAYADGKITTLAEGADLESPNGLLVDGGRLMVASMGQLGQNGKPGRLHAIDLKTREKKTVTPNPVGALDGLESDGRGGYIVTDFSGARVLHITASGEVHPLHQLSGSAADLAVLPAQKLIVVPDLQGSRVAAYDLSNVLK